MVSPLYWAPTTAELIKVFKTAIAPILDGVKTDDKLKAISAPLEIPHIPMPWSDLISDLFRKKSIASSKYANSKGLL